MHFHFCAEELMALTALQQHAACILCYIRAGWRMLVCHLKGHHATQNSNPLDILNEEFLCPDCRHENFILGPSGGAAINIKCGRCGSKFWFCPPFTPERINNEDSFYNPIHLVNLRDECCS